MQSYYTDLSLKRGLSTSYLKSMPKFIPLLKTVHLKLLLPQFWIPPIPAGLFHICEQKPSFCQCPNHTAVFPINSLLLLRLYLSFSTLISLPLPQYGIFWMVAGMKKHWKGVLSWRKHYCSTGSNSSLAHSLSSHFFVFPPPRKGAGRKVTDLGNCKLISFVRLQIHLTLFSYLSVESCKKRCSGVIFSHANIQVWAGIWNTEFGCQETLQILKLAGVWEKTKLSKQFSTVHSAKALEITDTHCYQILFKTS